MMAQEKALLRSRQNSYDDLEANRHGSSSTPMRMSRKMVRVLSRVVTRKQLVVIFLILGITFFTHHSSRTIYSSQSASSTGAYYSQQCPTNETYNIPVPPAADKAYLNALWNSLSKNFDANPPTPKHVDHPMQGDPPVGGKHTGTLFEFSDQDALDSRRAHELVIKELPEYPKGKFKGRGVVMLAGGRYSEYAATALSVLRTVGSKLPVEVWMSNPTEETPYWCEELEREGMACRRLSDYMDMVHLKHPYSWKVFTLLYSSFKEVLFLDADSMPVKSPDFIFDSEPYQNTGAILWPDYWNNTGSPYAPYVTGQTDKPNDDFQNERSVESGQIVWNKERHWKSLLLACYYNYWGPDLYFTLINNGYAGWGDKDTFPIAMKALKEDYTMVKVNLGTAFIQGTVHGIAMLQADPTYTDKLVPLFMHSNIVKWAARKFYCNDACRKLGEYKIMPSHAVNTGSAINNHLHNTLRIFKEQDMRKLNMDPEPIMWRAMEKAACRSNAWGEPEVCGRIRNHMQGTFGMEFVPMGPNNEVGPGNQVCLQLPSAEHSDDKN